MSDSPLPEPTEEDLWYFQHNGFHRVRQALPEELLVRLNVATNRAIADCVEPVVWETGSTDRRPEDVRRLSKILSRDEAYLQAASHPIILDTLTGLIGPNVELLTNKHNHIMVRPAGSEPVYWHAGEETWDPCLLTALIYLEESTLENGCIRLVPGSHRRPFRHPRRPGGEWTASEWLPRSLPVPMPRGGILLFNDACFHASDVNRSDGSRRSMTFGYRAHDTHDIDKDDPVKILVRGERVYTGHPHPFPGEQA